MRIENVAIENYKSFLERQTLHLEPGFNLLVGTNNAGKTTILDVIDLETGLNEPHRSERTIPNYGGVAAGPSLFEVTLATTYHELYSLGAGRPITFPISRPSERPTEEVILQRMEQARLFALKNGRLQIKSNFGSGFETIEYMVDDVFFGLANSNDARDVQAITISGGQNNQPHEISSLMLGGSPINYAQQFRSRIYRFAAQRIPGLTCSAQTTSKLDRTATILPYCINHLQTNDAHGHRILCDLINRIFPSVKWVQSTPIGSNFEIRCLPCEPKSRRDDLATPLARMGAGIGNVISMLYVVLTSREPQVIAIDEPNAFLHPRALRELLAILGAEGKQHQFVLTAHSPDVLTAVKAQTISLLDFDGVATTVKQVGLKDLHTVRGGLADLGIRMTDLHAKDRVIWVEGQTEEIVLPELLRWSCPEVAAGTSVLRVERTGTFSKKGMDVDEVVRIYERLSASSALVPPMVCILLDGESRDEENRKKLEASSQGKLRFLDRKMLENYLLETGAIIAALDQLGQTVSRDDVHDALSTLADLQHDLSKLDGADILRRLFSQLSGATLEFRKTRDVPVMVSWLLENNPDHLKPLSKCLRTSFRLTT